MRPSKRSGWAAAAISAMNTDSPHANKVAGDAYAASMMSRRSSASSSSVGA
jgi:hypothetical protein